MPIDSLMHEQVEVRDMFDRQHASSNAALIPPDFFAVSSDLLPGIPTMISTRLQLELLLQEAPLDLKAISEVILADAGATLQIFRLIGQEYVEEEDRPVRIEDCIVSLNKDFWYKTVCSSGISHNGPLVSEWLRCRRVAECAREIARATDGVAPEEAYLAGLLYRLGTFAHLLGWNTSGSSNSTEQQALGLMLADYWRLPDCVLSAIRQQQEPVAASPWGPLLETACRLADQAVAA